MRLLGLAVLCFVMNLTAAALGIGLTLGLFWLKKIFWGMDQKKWELYFQRMTNGGWLLRAVLVLGAALSAAASLGYWILRGFDYSNPEICILFCTAAEAAHLIFRFWKKRETLAEKLDKLKGKTEK